MIAILPFRRPVVLAVSLGERNPLRPLRVLLLDLPRAPRDGR